VGEALKRLKAFNYKYIYKNELIWKQTPKIEMMFTLLFERYLNDLEKGNETSDIYKGFLEGMSSEYKDSTSAAGIVRDFIAGMTDDYFLGQCQKHLIPQIKLTSF
jgi:dGTPase